MELRQTPWGSFAEPLSTVQIVRGKHRGIQAKARTAEFTLRALRPAEMARGFVVLIQHLACSKL